MRGDRQRWLAQCDSPSPHPLPLGEGFVGLAPFIRLGSSIWRWLPYIVGAHGRAPLPGITKPEQHHETRPTTRPHTYNPSRIPTVIPASLIIIILASPTVIPAKAGIHTPAI